MVSLRGKIALVTGASEGIGAAIATTLVREGATVIGCARNSDKIWKMSESIKHLDGTLHAIRCDLSKEEDILSMFCEIKEKYRGLDICINNAGLAKIASVIDGKTEDLRTLINVNCIALSICSKEAIRLFELKGCDGQIVNIGSIYGHVVPPHGRSHFYCGSKWMVRALTEFLRLELREKGKRTRVSLISPGLVETQFAIRNLGEEKGRQRYKENECLDSEQIAAMVLMVLSSEPNMEVNDIVVRPTSMKV